jgi:hypothetical protein
MIVISVNVDASAIRCIHIGVQKNDDPNSLRIIKEKS